MDADAGSCPADCAGAVVERLIIRAATAIGPSRDRHCTADESVAAVSPGVCDSSGARSGAEASHVATPGPPPSTQAPPPLIEGQHAAPGGSVSETSAACAMSCANEVEAAETVQEVEMSDSTCSHQAFPVAPPDQSCACGGDGEIEACEPAAVLAPSAEGRAAVEDVALPEGAANDLATATFPGLSAAEPVTAPPAPVEESLEELIALRVPDTLTSMGWLPRALPPARVFVQAVVLRSWAARQGILEHDELMQVDGRPVALMSRSELIEALRRRPLELLFRRVPRQDGERASNSIPYVDAETVDEAEETWGSGSPVGSSVSEVSEDISVASSHSLHLRLDDDGEDGGSEDLHAEASSASFSDFASRAEADARSSSDFAAGEEVRLGSDHSDGLGFGYYASSESDLSVCFAFAAFPTVELEEKDIKLLPPDSTECPICLDDYAIGDIQMTLPCFHRFHEHCGQRWLRRSTTCPTCKFSVSISDLQLDHA